MQNEDIINLFTRKFEETPEWENVNTPEEVYEVFLEVEQFLTDNGISHEFDLDLSDFSDLPEVGEEEEDLDEVKFEIPLWYMGEPVELVLEFYYRKEIDHYSIFADIDYYFDPDEFE